MGHSSRWMKGAAALAAAMVVAAPFVAITPAGAGLATDVEPGADDTGGCDLLAYIP